MKESQVQENKDACILLEIVGYVGIGIATKGEHLVSPLGAGPCNG